MDRYCSAIEGFLLEQMVQVKFKPNSRDSEMIDLVHSVELLLT